MSYDKTCCGTTCDAKANAEYVAKLARFASCAYEALLTSNNLRAFGRDVWQLMVEYEDVIKHAQHNHNSNGAS